MYARKSELQATEGGPQSFKNPSTNKEKKILPNINGAKASSKANKGEQVIDDKIEKKSARFYRKPKGSRHWNEGIRYWKRQPLNHN